MSTRPADPAPPAADGPGGGGGGGESLTTVLVALAANALIAAAKTVAAVLTGAASMLAEAAHSWADTGNEVFLLLAQRKADRRPDASHPFGYGREVYVWSMFAAIGLFAVGAGVSVTHGVQELLDPQPAESFTVAYVVLGVSFVLEGWSFAQATRQARRAARERDVDVLDHVLTTSDPTVRAVFLEDAAALVGILLATAGIALHQVTGSAVPDAVGSILVGLLLAVVAVVLIERNRRFLVGQDADPRARDALHALLLSDDAVERVTELHVLVVGAGRVVVTGAVDLAGDAREADVARALAGVERRLRTHPAVVGAVLSLSEADEPALVPGPSPGQRDVRR